MFNKTLARSATLVCCLLRRHICGFMFITPFHSDNEWKCLGDAKEPPMMIQEELKRMESELREQIRELQEAPEYVKRSGSRDWVLADAQPLVMTIVTIAIANGHRNSG